MNPQIVQQSRRFSSLMHGLTPGQPDESGNGRMDHWDAPEVHLVDRFELRLLYVGAASSSAILTKSCSVVADREVQAPSHTVSSLYHDHEGQSD
jgi:hypothetical protein